MDKLHGIADKLFEEVDHLEDVLDGSDDPARVPLALAVAKRVRAESTLVVRALARERDNTLQPGGTST